MRRRPSRRALVLLTALLASAGLFVAVRASSWPSENALVGQTETAIVGRYGQPKHEFAGHYGNPPITWRQQFKGEVKSAVFWRLGGEIYVTFEKRNGQWIVVSNSYLPRGAVY